MNEIELDFSGEVVAVPRPTVQALAAASAARAGVSSRHRDLSLVLGKALDQGRAMLGRGDVWALRAVLEEERDRLPAGTDELLRLAASG